jgi:hypothetical protein
MLVDARCSAASFDASALSFSIVGHVAFPSPLSSRIVVPNVIGPQLGSLEEADEQIHQDRQPHRERDRPQEAAG